MKTVQLTDDEIAAVIRHHAMKIVSVDKMGPHIERMKYLDKRLNANKEEKAPTKAQAKAWGGGD